MAREGEEIEMYYEEKIIGGVMCYRTNPDSKFTQYTMTELSIRYEGLLQECQRLTNEAYYSQRRRGD